jgi:hypothetical protein
MQQLRVKLKAAKFLRDTLDEIAEINEKKSKEVDEQEKNKAHEFSKFLEKVYLFKFI